MAKVGVIGDSIAVGLNNSQVWQKTFPDATAVALGGKNATTILNNVRNDPSVQNLDKAVFITGNNDVAYGRYFGGTPYVQGGINGDPIKLANTLQATRDATGIPQGAGVWVLSNNPQVAAIQQQIATANGDRTVPFQASVDNIHPANSNTLAKDVVGSLQGPGTSDLATPFNSGTATAGFNPPVGSTLPTITNSFGTPPLAAPISPTGSLPNYNSSGSAPSVYVSTAEYQVGDKFSSNGTVYQVTSKVGTGDNAGGLLATPVPNGSAYSFVTAGVQPVVEGSIIGTLPVSYTYAPGSSIPFANYTNTNLQGSKWDMGAAGPPPPEGTAPLTSIALPTQTTQAAPSSLIVTGSQPGDIVQSNGQYYQVTNVVASGSGGNSPIGYKADPVTRTEAEAKLNTDPQSTGISTEPKYITEVAYDQQTGGNFAVQVPNPKYVEPGSAVASNGNSIDTSQVRDVTGSDQYIDISQPSPVTPGDPSLISRNETPEQFGIGSQYDPSIGSFTQTFGSSGNFPQASPWSPEAGGNGPQFLPEQSGSRTAVPSGNPITSSNPLNGGGTGTIGLPEGMMPEPPTGPAC